MAIILIINTFRTLEINQRLATVIKNWYGIAIRIDIVGGAARQRASGGQATPRGRAAEAAGRSPRQGGRLRRVSGRRSLLPAWEGLQAAGRV